MEKFRKKPARVPIPDGAISNFRRENNLSLAEMASLLGVSTACVFTWERGGRAPIKRNLKKLCKAGILPAEGRGGHDPE